MQLAADVDLKVYAEKTEGFSGADLQGFLYNAHLEAIHGAIDMDTFKEAQNTKSANKASSDKSDFVMNQTKKVPLTLAEKGHISQRVRICTLCAWFIVLTGLSFLVGNDQKGEAVIIIIIEGCDRFK